MFQGFKWKSLAGALFLAVTISFFLHLQSWRVADLDNLYHFRHAWVYQTQGFLDSSFPWVQYSVVKDAGADLWYGFHLFLYPFTFLGDPLTGVKAASVTVTAAGILLLFFSLKRLGARWPHFWVLVFLLSSPSLFYRSSALRPQLISFGLSFLFFAYFLKPPIDRRKNFAVFFLISFFTAWVHGALIWVNFIIFAIGSLLEKFFKKGSRWQIAVVLAAGTLAGLFLRPHPLSGLRLIYVQIVQNSLEEFSKTPLLWGTELLHLDGRSFFYQFLPIVFLLLAAIFFIYRFAGKGRGKTVLGQDFKAQVWTAFLAGAFFFWLAFASARRSADYFFGFAVVIIALVFSEFYRQRWGGSKKMILEIGKPVYFLILTVFIYMAGFTIYRYEYLLPKTYNPERAKEAAEWLRDNSQAGDIVFHTRWDQFAELFFWNQKNYYINGMDPIFMYVRDPSLYWQQHYFALDQAAALTCKAMRCTQEEAEDSYKVLTQDFKARYIYLQKEKNFNFVEYLNSDSRFKKVFENNEDAIFLIVS